MKKKLLIIVLAIIMCIACTSNSLAYPLTYQDTPLIDKSQAEQFLKDRYASKKMLNCLDYIYEYSKEVGIDPGVVVAMSSIETGYGKSHLFVAHNNPGGIKSSRSSDGWAHYDSAKAGYRAMINLLATYAGINNNTKSYLYGVSKTTQGLAGIYWTNYGNDRGYHGMLSRQIEKMRSYPIIKKETIKQTNKKQDVLKKVKPKAATKPSSGLDIIYDILGKDKNSSGYDYIMNILNN